MTLLTRDNHHLSEPKPAPSEAERFGEINCMNDPGQPEAIGQSLAHAIALQGEGAAGSCN